MLDTRKALVLFSGGQDSTTCLAWALDRFDHVETIGFDYGQRHVVELECRKKIFGKLRSDFGEWSEKLGKDEVVNLGFLGELSETAMTSEVEIALLDSGLPNTFVPGRNLIFLNVAAALAYRRGIKNIVGGMCETDYSGYPDCRDDAIKATQLSINEGMGERFVIHTPLMWLDKAETWAQAELLGQDALVDLIVGETHTCYLGVREEKHPWGFGCGECPACELRAKGFKKWGKDRSSAASP
jgi:7-cyano-7-deazaguanine synthase